MALAYLYNGDHVCWQQDF